MTQVTKPFTFANGQVIDANQMNQDFDTLYNDVNGNLDDSNIRPGSLSNSIATEGVHPSQTEGVPYAVDVFGSNGFVLSGLTVVKDGVSANKIDVSAGVAYVKQSDGSLRRIAPSATSFTTTTPNTTYYLDLNPDASWSFTTAHSTQTNYVPIASVTTDASGNVATVTDARPTTVNVFGSAAGPFAFPANITAAGNNVLTDGDANKRVFVDLQQNAQQNIPNNAWTAVIFQIKNQDNLNNFFGSTFTAPKTGIYVVTGELAWSGTPPSTTYLGLYKNGSFWKRLGTFSTPAGIFSIPFSAVVRLNANDALQLVVFASASQYTSGNGDTWMTIVQVA